MFMVSYIFNVTEQESVKSYWLRALREAERGIFYEVAESEVIHTLLYIFVVKTQVFDDSSLFRVLLGHCLK